MTTPIATIASATATGDIVVGPGAPTRLEKGLPAACVGDAVAGAACTGVITGTTALTTIMSGRPAANLTAPVTGVNPATGVPVATAVGVRMAASHVV